MKKLKLLIASMIGAIALVFACVTGGRINAATVTRTYDFYNNNLKGTADLTLVANEENEDFECASSEDSTEKMTLNIDNVSNGTFRWKNSDAYVEFQCKNNSAATLTYTFTTKGDATLASKINTGGGSKYVKYSIDNGTKTQFASGTTGGTEFSFDFVGAGEHTLVFSDALGSSGSNMKIYSLTITDVYDTSSAEDQAVAAISAIGTVEYTTACKNLIAAATSRVNAVAEEKRNSTYISNYDTYTAAVTAFNTLETTAITTFTTAVSNIGEVTASSGTAISTAENAYNALLASTKEKSTVVAAKTTLDDAKLAYADALYDTLSKSFSTNDDETITSSKVTLSGDQQLGNSIFTATTGMNKQDAASLTIGSDSWSTRYYTNGNSTCSSTKKERLIYFTAKTSGTLKIAATSQNATDTTRKVDVYNESYTKIASISAQIADSNNTYIYVNIPSSGKYYIGSTSGVNFFYLEFIPETTYVANDVALTFEAQYNEEAAADSTKLRFIGTIDGIAYADYANIDSIKFTFTFKETARTASVNNLYKSIVNGETVLKAAADDTMYVIYQLNNINKAAYQGQKLTNCKFIVTFTDGSTVSVNRADITLPSEFTTVQA